MIHDGKCLCSCHHTPSADIQPDEDTKGGTCPKCGAWKGGDYGMNGNGVQSKHVCGDIQPEWEETTRQEFRKFQATKLGASPEWEISPIGTKTICDFFFQKFREEMLSRDTKLREAIEIETGDVVAPPEDAERFMGDWERGVVSGGWSVKKRILALLDNQPKP